MLSRNILLIRLAVIVCAVAVISALSAAALSAIDFSPPKIAIVYPKPDQRLTAVDSSFILGNISPAEASRFYRLTINGVPVAVHKDGGFIAFLPLKPGLFTFELQVTLESTKETLYSELPPVVKKSLMVEVPSPLSAIPEDSLTIEGDFDPPQGDIVLAASEILVVSFKGTPGGRAWFSIPGVIDSVPMSERSPRQQAYWGEAVFGSGAVPDSLLVDGIYSGFLMIEAELKCDTARIIYHLAPPDPADIFMRYFLPPYDTDDMRLLVYLTGADTIAVADSSCYRITLNSDGYPFTVRFTDSVQIIRHGPRKGYLATFQPQGVMALAIGAEQEWYRIRLSETQFGWVHHNSVEKLPVGILPPKSLLSVIRTSNQGDRLRIEFPLSGKHAFKVIEDTRRRLRMRIFGVTSDTDWIRYDFSDPLVDLATWTQIEPDLYQLTLELKQSLWGYDAYYDGNTLILELIYPPANLNKLKGKTIVIDPGHSGDPGAIGPTGYTEAEANLKIALLLRERLQKKGARVILTRDDMSHVNLYDRPAIALSHDADLFISIHNNALPDGVNPFVNHGTSSYYYHPHSIDLARSIHRQMLAATDLRDNGLYHGNLAVNRPTQYPAVLVECAFMILPEHEAMLKERKFCDRVAKAITKGVEKFLKDFDHD